MEQSRSIYRIYMSFVRYDNDGLLCTSTACSFIAIVRGRSYFNDYFKRDDEDEATTILVCVRVRVRFN